jgi:hypothetical protein
MDLKTLGVKGIHKILNSCLIKKWQRKNDVADISVKYVEEFCPTKNSLVKVMRPIYARHVLRNPRRNGKKPSLLTAFPGCTDMGTFPETTKGC